MATMTKKKIAQLKRFEKLTDLMQSSQDLNELLCRLGAIREFKEKNSLWGDEFTLDKKKVPYFSREPMHYTARAVYKNAISWDEDRYIAWVDGDYELFEQDADPEFLERLAEIKTNIHNAKNIQSRNVSYAMLMLLLEIYGKEETAFRLVNQFYSDLKQNPQYQF